MLWKRYFCFIFVPKNAYIFSSWSIFRSCTHKNIFGLLKFVLKKCVPFFYVIFENEINSFDISSLVHFYFSIFPFLQKILKAFSFIIFSATDSFIFDSKILCIICDIKYFFGSMNCYQISTLGSKRKIILLLCTAK